MRRPSQNLYLEPRGCWGWGGTREGLRLLPDPGFIFPQAEDTRGISGPLRGTPEKWGPLWPPQERDGAAKKLFQCTKIAEMSPD